MDQCIKMNEGKEHRTSLQSIYLLTLLKNIFCGRRMIWDYDKPVQYGVLQIHKSGATTTISSILTTPLVSSEMKSWQCCAWIKLKIKEIKERITWTLFSFEKKYFSCCWMLTRYLPLHWWIRRLCVHVHLIVTHVGSWEPWKL